MVLSQRSVYLYILNDCGGSVSTSGRPSLISLLAAGLSCDDEFWVQAILGELEDLGIVKVVANRSAEIIRQVDPETLDSGDDDAETEPPATAPARPAVPSPAQMRTAVRSRKRPAPPAPKTRPPAKLPAWTSATGMPVRQPLCSAREMTRAKKRIARLEQLVKRLNNRLEVEQSWREKAVRQASQVVTSTATHYKWLHARVLELIIERYYSKQQADAELSIVRQQLAEAQAAAKHLQHDLDEAKAQANRPTQELVAEVERLRTECERLRRAKAKADARVIALIRDLDMADKIQQVDTDEIERLWQALEKFRPVVEAYHAAARTPTRLSCGHAVVTMCSAGHLAGVKRGCNSVEVVERTAEPQPRLSKAKPPEVAPGLRGRQRK